MSNPHFETVSLAPAVSIVVASMIGVGVFTSAGFQLAAVPSGFPILLLWLLGGIVSYCGALCYAELIALFPRSGGEYRLLRESMHPLAGFLAGWISLFAGFSATIAAVALAFGTYLKHMGFSALSPTVTGAVVIVAIAAIHLGRLSQIGRFLTWTTALKLFLIVAFLVAALSTPATTSNSLSPRTGDLHLLTTPAFASSFVYVLFAYSGWNGAAYIAGEVRNAPRVVPLSFGLGVGLVTALYIALNAVFLWRTPWPELTGRVEVGLITAESLFGSVGGRIMSGLIALGALSTIAAFTWAGSRVAKAMGDDFSSLKWLAITNRASAPVGGLAFQNALALLMLLSGSFDQVVNYLTGLLIVSSLLTVLAVPLMRKRAPQALRTFRVPLYPIPILVFVAASIWMLVFQARERPNETLLGLATLIVGAMLYARVRQQQHTSV